MKMIHSASQPAPWLPLGAVVPERLSASRFALHQAVQLLASFGQTLVQPRDDDSHRAMTWEASRRAFRSETSDDGLQTLLLVPGLSLEVWRRGALVADLALRGHTVEEARAWLGETVGRARGSGPLEMAWPEYDVPAPRGGPGAPLDPEPAALGELARWYTDAALVLDNVRATWPEASPVRCWPHHFDLATLLTFPASGVPDETCSVGVGLSPGDESREHPYFYVNGWPSPDTNLLPRLLGAGHWNTEGWVGAVLPADAVVEERQPPAQAAMVDDFVATAVVAMRDVVLAGRRAP